MRLPPTHTPTGTFPETVAVNLWGLDAIKTKVCMYSERGCGTHETALWQPCGTHDTYCLQPERPVDAARAMQRCRRHLLGFLCRHLVPLGFALPLASPCLGFALSFALSRLEAPLWLPWQL